MFAMIKFKILKALRGKWHPIIWVYPRHRITLHLNGRPTEANIYSQREGKSAEFILSRQIENKSYYNT